MCDLRPAGKEESGTENDIAFQRRSTLLGVTPTPIFQSRLVLRLYTFRYYIDFCNDLKQPATDETTICK